MENLRVLLCCGAGMSSGFLASGARKLIKKQKLPMTIEARSYAEAADFMSSIDVMFLDLIMQRTWKNSKKSVSLMVCVLV